MSKNNSNSKPEPVIIKVRVPETFRGYGFMNTQEFTSDRFKFTILRELQCIAITARTGEKRTHTYPFALCCLELATEREWVG